MFHPIGNLCTAQIRQLMDEVLAGFHFDKVATAIDRLVND